MSRYIDVNAYIKYCEENWIPLNVEVIKKQPTVDMEEIIINELTNKISERIIKFLETNYEITPKKPAVRCKDCKWHSKFLGEGFCSNFSITGFENDDYCSYGVKRDDAKIH